jgi:DNA polymerase III subunit chi
VFFYHLTRTPLEVTLAELLGKARQAGWRVAVRGVDIDRMKALDEKLWQAGGDGFLPHGLGGGAQDADQPILLTCEAMAANAPACVMSVDGAVVDADEVKALERVCVLFDGNDAQAVQIARDQWKALTEAGCPAQYWSHDAARWEKKAER